jgi:hypothetical protein
MVELSLLEHYLPRFDFAERYTTTVAAPLERVWEAVLDLDLSESTVVRTLFRLRGLPASALRLEGLERMGFLRLGERPKRELALGVAGKFWTPGGNLRRLTPQSFESFAEPGFAKAVWAFHLEAAGSASTQLSTETRILCLDAASCGLFRVYWLVVRPLSGWTRREALRLTRRRAEAADRRA